MNDEKLFTETWIRYYSNNSNGPKVHRWKAFIFRSFGDAENIIFSIRESPGKVYIRPFWTRISGAIWTV